MQLLFFSPSFIWFTSLFSLFKLIRLIYIFRNYGFSLSISVFLQWFGFACSLWDVARAFLVYASVIAPKHECAISRRFIREMAYIFFSPYFRGSTPFHLSLTNKFIVLALVRDWLKSNMNKWIEVKHRFLLRLPINIRTRDRKTIKLNADHKHSSNRNYNKLIVSKFI